MTRLYFIRHGESNVNIENLMGGHKSDKGLTALGIQQAERLRDRLAASGEIQPDVLLSSPLPRAKQTAQIIAPALGLPLTFDPEIEEVRPGELVDELSFVQAVAQYGPPEFDNPDKAFFPGTETLREFVARVQQALNRIAHEYAGKTVVMVTHGGFVENGMIYLTGGDRWTYPFPLPFYTFNTSITLCEQKIIRIIEKPSWMLLKYNDAAHLLDLASSERFNWAALRARAKSEPDSQ